MTFIFHISLKDSNPEIWRRFAVDSNCTFGDFHNIIQDVMGWETEHMWMFSPKGYGSKLVFKEDNEFTHEEFFPIELLQEGQELTYDAYEVKLSDYFKKKNDKITYIYDFGDDWTHLIVLEKIEDTKILYPRCLDGAGACPLEDSGGVHGYEYMLSVLKDPNHPDYHDYAEFLGLENGETFEPYPFDIEEINQILIDDL